MLNKLDHWHKTRVGLAVFGVVELAIAYGFASLAIDRGNLWWYVLTLIFLVGALQNAAHFIGTFLHGGKGAKRG
ncbi:MAG TPA: hypothetical protein VG992_04140 [Candidatus Saccharimonadales bacterium]|nr:hypothetical protein [Candidatus Saccharimonadales bacterium]